MALIQCPECGKEVSDKARKCPHCGYPLEDIDFEKEEAAMEKVLEWNKEREYLLEGNVPEKSLGR